MPPEEGFKNDDEIRIIHERIISENKARTIESLKQKFNIPTELEELAYEIWCDGKYD